MTRLTSSHGAERIGLFVHGLKWSVKTVDGTIVLHISGEVDLANVRDFRRIIQQVLSRANSTPVLIDLTEMGYMDSQGYRVLENVTSNLPGVRMKVSPLVRRLLTILDAKARIRLVE